jgi:choline dehydrogenase-like flavoprotein
MLSGIGAAAELEKHKIPLVIDAPAVGTEFHDHLALTQWWKLRKPEEGYALGNPRWTSPGFFVGLPCDVSTPKLQKYWIETEIADSWCSG